MTNPRKTTSDRLANIRAYLEKKNKSELVALMLDLVQEMDEPTRQRFWEHLAPPGMATADLRYPSADDFLSELEAFTEGVSEGEYYDEDAAMYYSDDNYHEYEDYDPDDHVAIKVLNGFFHEADSYFDAGQFSVAAEAYDRLLELALSETYDTLGIPTPLEFLEQDERQVVGRYFAALHACRSQEEFFDQALFFLAGHEHPTDLEYFLELVGNERLTLQAYLEAWADRHIQNAPSTYFYGLAFQLRLLLRFYEQDGRIDDMRNLWVRFRRLYPACYTPLLADRQATGDWQSVLHYAQEALEDAHPPHSAYYREEWDSPDTLSLRDYLARAYSAAGDPAKAFKLYRPAFNEMPCFETYAQVRRLANAVSVAMGAGFIAEAIDWLCQQGDQRRYLLCQVYLSEKQFDEAYSLVASLVGYQGIEESKLVAKAHLLAAFGPSPDDRMESNLRDLYDKVERGEKESYRFLRDVLPRLPVLSKDLAIERAEGIYRRLMQAHIDHGRSRYATGAYYCALLGEIALHEGRLAAFKQWYEKYMEAYKRFRALRAEMDMKVGKILHSRLSAGY
jgi:hypothetical protein